MTALLGFGLGQREIRAAALEQVGNVLLELVGPNRRKLSFGWGTWIRTKIDGVRVRSSTVELSPKQTGHVAEFSCER